jgi:hypothetical protein
MSNSDVDASRTCASNVRAGAEQRLRDTFSSRGPGVRLTKRTSICSVPGVCSFTTLNLPSDSTPERTALANVWRKKSWLSFDSFQSFGFGFSTHGGGIRGVSSRLSGLIVNCLYCLKLMPGLM